MKQHFFTDTVQSRFIKALLYNTPLPICDTVSEGDFVVEGFYYIFNKNLIKCSSSGYLKNGANYQIISPFNFGKYYPMFSEKFQSNYSYYDSETHKFLGKYLRCFSNISGMDLMCYYNCFSGEYNPYLVLNDYGVYAGSNKNIKVVQVPVKFNKTYTIAVECSAEVRVSPGFLVNNNLLVEKDENSDSKDVTAGYIETHEGAIKRYNSTSFKRPFTFKIDNTNLANCKAYQKYQRNLYLLIQIPASNNSSIVILEGDYSQQHVRHTISVPDVYRIAKPELNKRMTSQLSLLLLDDNVRYPFADRLMEYLLWNVVDEDDQIQQNVMRIRRGLNIGVTTEVPKDIWTPTLRKLIYDRYMDNSKYQKIDINGFADKDVERLSLRG